LFSAAMRRGILVSSHALVGSADYLWILSRTPEVPETAKSELLAEAQRRGYVTDKLIWVKQK
jgi:lipocalin